MAGFEKIVEFSSVLNVLESLNVFSSFTFAVYIVIMYI